MFDARAHQGLRDQHEDAISERHLPHGRWLGLQHHVDVVQGHVQGTARGQDHHEDERVRGRGPGQVVQAGRRLGLGLGARGLLLSRCLAGPGPPGCGPHRSAGEALGLRGRMPIIPMAARAALPGPSKERGGVGPAGSDSCLTGEAGQVSVVQD